MSVTTGIPFNIGPLNNIQPFTYRDQLSHMGMLEKLRVYINESLRPEFNEEMQRILDEFQDGVTNTETNYLAFVDQINEAVMQINNRVGPESMHRVELAADYVLTVDPVWPDEHPIRFQFTQDSTGGHAVTFDSEIIGSAGIDPTPGVMTEIELVPDGTGNWMIRTLNKPPVIDVVKEFGARPGGFFDNTVKFNAAMDEARVSKREVFIPAGVWLSSGEVNISGVTIRGVMSGYQNQDGTIIRGDGTNIAFNQSDVSPLANVHSGIHNIRFENVQTGLRVSYSVNSYYSDLYIMDATGDALICGDIGIIGPLWNVFDRCVAISTNGYGLRLAGLNWCNSNLFETCFFKGTTGAVNILSASGFGSLDNKFHNTEITNAVGPGIVFNGTNRSTTIEKCFLEPKGPAIVVNASTQDLQLVGNVYGSTRNNIVGYGPNFIDHKAASLGVRVLGGWITTNAIPEQVDLRFIGSDIPANLVVEYLAEPSTVGIASTGYKIHDETLISAAQKVHRGNLLVKKYLAPSIELSYADGTRLFTMKRNGTQGGADFGVTFTNEGNLAMTIASNGMVILNGNLGTAKSTTATTPGTLARKVQVYDDAQNPIGFLLIYSGSA